MLSLIEGVNISVLREEVVEQSTLLVLFAQENSLSSGIGLGLSIVRSIVVVVGGDITIGSEPSCGSPRYPLP